MARSPTATAVCVDQTHRDICGFGVRTANLASALRPGTANCSAAEGVPLVITLSAQDSDFDLLNWQVQGLPTGMVAEPMSVAGSTRLALRWTACPLAPANGSILADWG